MKFDIEIFQHVRTISGATIADALAIGYRAILIDDASRGVDLADIESTKNTIIKNNGVIVTSDEVRVAIFRVLY